MLGPRGPLKGDAPLEPIVDAHDCPLAARRPRAAWRRPCGDDGELDFKLGTPAGVWTSGPSIQPDMSCWGRHRLYRPRDPALGKAGHVVRHARALETNAGIANFLQTARLTPSPGSFCPSTALRWSLRGRWAEAVIDNLLV
jgi:hypothetical protein